MIYDNGNVIEESVYDKDGGKFYHKKMDGQCTFWHTDGSISAMASLYPNEIWPLGKNCLPKAKEFYKISTRGDLLKIKEVKWYREGGKILIENFFNEDGVSIIYKEYDIAGTKVFEWFLEGEQYIEISYYENGQKAISTEFILEQQGEIRYQHGEKIFYSSDGTLINHGLYSYDKKIGEWIVYFNHDYTEEVTFPSEASYYRVVTYDESGKPIGIVKDYYISGQIQWEGQILNERPDEPIGECKFYFKSGQVQVIINYNNQSQKHGDEIEFLENGSMFKKGKWVNGQLVSRFIYYESGHVKEKQNYETVEYIDPFDTQQFARPIKMRIAKIIMFFENGDDAITGNWRIDTYTGSSTKLGDWTYYTQEREIEREEFYDASGIIRKKPKPKQGSESQAVQQLKIELKMLRKNIEKSYSVDDPLKSMALGSNQTKVKKKSIYNAYIKAYDYLFPILDTLPEDESITLASRLKELCSRVREYGDQSKSQTKDLERSLTGVSDIEQILQLLGV